MSPATLSAFPSLRLPRLAQADWFARVDALLEEAPGFLGKSSQHLVSNGEAFSIPRYVFLGPKGGGEPIRLGIFAGIHGDEPEGVRALIEFLKLLTRKPELATGYCLYIYPVLNPAGLADRTRHSRSGKDLNREFWQDSPEPEIRHIEAELLANRFDGIISLHTDDTSHGFYGYAHGPTLARQLLEPALKSAEQLLPRNRDSIIDGFTACDGVIGDKFDGILSAPPDAHPRPFEIILETPQSAPEFLKQSALVLSLQTILEEYRRFISFAADL